MQDIEIVDQPEIDDNILVANLEKDLKEFETELDLEANSRADNDHKTSVIPHVYSYDVLHVIDDDYLPDISEAIMNVAMLKTPLSKAA